MSLLNSLQHLPNYFVHDLSASSSSPSNPCERAAAGAATNICAMRKTRAQRRSTLVCTLLILIPCTLLILCTLVCTLLVHSHHNTACIIQCIIIILYNTQYGCGSRCICEPCRELHRSPFLIVLQKKIARAGISGQKTEY